ncbi:MAG: hypothetical protein K6T55_11910 [Syntrophobacterales bacterium]|nr:hypothetical protein [Syntrophobacterales bacterium]
MPEIKQWLRLDPLDTLFFRGSEPMLAGESHEVASRFPPLPSTLVGALVTAILAQRDLLKDWVSGNIQEIHNDYPLLGKPPETIEESYQPGFQVAGPILLATLQNTQQECFFPAPAHWFAANGKGGSCIDVQRADLPDEMFAALPLKGTVPRPVWVKKPLASDLKSVIGRWANRAAFEVMKKGQGKLKQYECLSKVPSGVPLLMEQRVFTQPEKRMGIALEAHRRPRRGHLYLAAHQRLAPGVQLLLGLSEELAPAYLDNSGLLQLGGENRLVHYEVLTQAPPLPQGNGPWHLALTAVPLTSLKKFGLDGRPRVSGSLLRVAGWDVKHGFHKPVTAYLPAGTVIHHPEGNLPFGFLPL